MITLSVHRIDNAAGSTSLFPRLHWKTIFIIVNNVSDQGGRWPNRNAGIPEFRGMSGYGTLRTKSLI